MRETSGYMAQEKAFYDLTSLYNLDLEQTDVDFDTPPFHQEQRETAMDALCVLSGGGTEIQEKINTWNGYLGELKSKRLSIQQLLPQEHKTETTSGHTIETFTSPLSLPGEIQSAYHHIIDCIQKQDFVWEVVNYTDQYGLLLTHIEVIIDYLDNKVNTPSEFCVRVFLAQLQEELSAADNITFLFNAYLYETKKEAAALMKEYMK